MTNSDDFFKQSKAAQATLKHAILRGYLATFATATGMKSPGHRVGYIDSYAGPGEYVNDLTGMRSDGSPLIAIDEARHQRSLRQPRELECVFVERKAKHYGPLRDLVDESIREGLRVEAHKGDVVELLGPSIDKFREAPLLVSSTPSVRRCRIPQAFPPSCSARAFSRPSFF